jgi:hypothetical protein
MPLTRFESGPKLYAVSKTTADPKTDLVRAKRWTVT